MAARSRALWATLASLLLLTACDPTGGRGVAGPPGTGSAETGPAGADHVELVHPVLEVRWVDAWIGGARSQSRGVVYPGGGVIRTSPEGWEYAALGDEWLQHLLRLADEQGLDAPDADLGGLMRTDSPWAEVTFHRTEDDGPGGTETVVLRVESPGLHDGLTDAQRDRKTAAETVLRQVLDEGTGRPYEPDHLLVQVLPTADQQEDPVPWTGRTEFGEGSCHTLGGEERALLDGLLDDQGLPRTGLDRTLVVEQDGRVVRLVVRDGLAHDPGCL